MCIFIIILVPKYYSFGIVTHCKFNLAIPEIVFLIILNKTVCYLLKYGKNYIFHYLIAKILQIKNPNSWPP